MIPLFCIFVCLFIVGLSDPTDEPLPPKIGYKTIDDDELMRRKVDPWLTFFSTLIAVITVFLIL